MVKKVGGPKSPGTKETTSVQPTKSVGAGKVGNIKGAEGKTKASRVSNPTQFLSAADREKLFKMINEEADKMFGPDGLPESNREVVEEAVKMAIDAGIVEEEEN